MAESTGAADLQREREARDKQDRESWRARLRQYVSARIAVVAPRDGWLGLDDEDDWAAMLLSRWPVLTSDFVRGPPDCKNAESATSFRQSRGGVRPVRAPAGDHVAIRSIYNTGSTPGESADRRLHTPSPNQTQ